MCVCVCVCCVVLCVLCVCVRVLCGCCVYVCVFCVGVCFDVHCLSRSICAVCAPCVVSPARKSSCAHASAFLCHNKSVVPCSTAFHHKGCLSESVFISGVTDLRKQIGFVRKCCSHARSAVKVHWTPRSVHRLTHTHRRGKWERAHAYADSRGSKAGDCTWARVTQTQGQGGLTPTQLLCNHLSLLPK